ncbi:MAG TPA: hypothetical protein PKE66_17240, partial [Pyrinomonadaceae bacterium]|nr:hypothetical protein [Pyrinomonadaceae bacterium]
MPEIIDLLETEPRGEAVTIHEYWSGESTPEGRHFSAQFFWSNQALNVRFNAEFREALVVSKEPQLRSKVIGLWERDVCEIFIAPDKNEPRKYFEFEVAPTGEWLDLAIDLTSDERVTDWEYNSGMKAAAKIEDGRVLMAMK